ILNSVLRSCPFRAGAGVVTRCGQHSYADGSTTSQDWNPDPQAALVGRISNPSYWESTSSLAPQFLEKNVSAGSLTRHGPLNVPDSDDFWSSFAAIRILTDPLTGR